MCEVAEIGSAWILRKALREISVHGGAVLLYRELQRSTGQPGGGVQYLNGRNTGVLLTTHWHWRDNIFSVICTTIHVCPPRSPPLNYKIVLDSRSVNA